MKEYVKPICKVHIVEFEDIMASSPSPDYGKPGWNNPHNPHNPENTNPGHNKDNPGHNKNSEDIWDNGLW